MWRAEHIHKMLPMLDAHSVIGEIILIDNDVQRANHAELSLIKKLVYLPQEQNIYVNPAWNLGVKIAKYDKLMFLNDDCLVNLNSLFQIYQQITPEKGLLGFSELSYCGFAIEIFESVKQSGIGDYVTFEESYGTNELSGMPHFSYGSVMFCHKDSYYEIPEEFKIYYGDLLNYRLNLKNGKKNYVIEDGLVFTKMSTTVSLSNPQIEKEREMFYQVFKRYEII
jgi:hypothetical protein